MENKSVILPNQTLQTEQENNYTPVPVPATPETAVINAMVDITKESIKCFSDYLKCKEHEKTERIRIQATLSAITDQIRAQKEMYIKTIEQNYIERKELYSKADQVLKYAMEIHDKDMIKCTYQYLLNIYNSSINSNFQLTTQFIDSHKTIEFF